ncbi:MAG: hypothetical protein IJD04_03645 [Desulfovibrionaceae bacterium]|nr:hypothetical protein [Desulfovibrionaceae bacterium]
MTDRGKIRRERFENALADGLRRPEVRLVLLEILSACNLMQASYAAGDALATAHNEGMRRVGLWLKGEIDAADPEAFARMLLEQD